MRTSGVLFAIALLAGLPAARAHDGDPAPPAGYLDRCEDLSGEFALRGRSIDSDGDDVTDRRDRFPYDPREARDTDGDGIANGADAFPDNPRASRDFDCDGIANGRDPVFDGKTCNPVRYAWTDGYYGMAIRHRICTVQKDSGEFVQRVTIPVHFEGRFTRAELDRWLAGAERFWSGRGIHLDIVSAPAGEDVNTVRIVRGRNGRSNAGTFYVDDRYFNVNVVAHEFGHHLGLPDEYCDANDKARFIGERRSIMRTTQDPRPFGRHLRLVKQNFRCPVSDATTTDPAGAPDAPARALSR